MAKSLDATDVVVVRPAGTVSPMDKSHGKYDNNDWYDLSGHDHGVDDNDFAR